MVKHYYAAHNICANRLNGDYGFLNTWEVSRFKSKADRDAFVAEYDNKNARVVTRKEASAIFDRCYTSNGKDVPKGGLFGTDDYGLSRFWNESEVYA